MTKVGRTSTEHLKKKNPRSELDHLLRVVKPSLGDSRHKDEKNIYFTMTLLKLAVAVIFIVLMNISTIPIVEVNRFDSVF